MSAASAYLQLTKPRLLPLVLFSGLPALVLGAQGWPSPTSTVAILLGISAAAGAANVFNSYLERDLDARMSRTAGRPLPSGQLDPHLALHFGLALAVLGPGLLWWTSGWFAAALALGGILFYVFVYTLWLKPRSTLAVVVGGVSGAVAPLIADAAIEGRIGPAGWLLFLILFVWQPPHFWAITLYRRQDYEAAGFPLLCQRVGEDATRRRIVLWIAALIPISLWPVVLSLLGPLYGVSAVLLAAGFLWSGVALLRERSVAAARRTFQMSLLYLMGLFLTMLADLAIRFGG